MIRFYISRIKKNKINIDEVPIKFREDVKKGLENNNT